MYRTNGLYPLYILYNYPDDSLKVVNKDRPSDKIRQQLVIAQKIEALEDELATAKSEMSYYNKFYQERVASLENQINELKSKTS